jgi:hypothetical protein
MMHAVLCRRAFLVCAATGAVAAAAAAPAAATMPGRNGVIAFAQSPFQDDPDGPVGPLRLVGFPGGALRDVAGSGSSASSSAAPSWQPLPARR